MSDFVERVTQLAEDAKAEGEKEAAIALYTLAGAMHSGMDGELAAVCKRFARQGKHNIEMRKAKLN